MRKEAVANENAANSLVIRWLTDYGKRFPEKREGLEELIASVRTADFQQPAGAGVKRKEVSCARESLPRGARNKKRLMVFFNSLREGFQEARAEAGAAPATIALELIRIRGMRGRGFHKDMVDGKVLKAFKTVKNRLKMGASAPGKEGEPRVDHHPCSGKGATPRGGLQLCSVIVPCRCSPSRSAR
jgi:hypothetical protein